MPISLGKVNDANVDSDPMAEAEAAFDAVVEGRGSVEDARAAYAPIEPFGPRGMFDPEAEADQDRAEKLYSDAVNSFKLALTALEADQVQLAKSYVKVAKIKLADARAAEQ